MLQPFQLFKSIYLNKLIKLKKRYLVTQTYKRATDHFADDNKTDILITDYDDAGQAKIHYNAIKTDKYRAIIDLEKPEHLAKIKEMMQEGSAYRLYWAVVESAKGLEKIINDKYKDHLRRYITKNTNWRVKGDTTLQPTLQISFGELFIVLKYGNQTLRVKFEEIERS